MAFSKAHKTYQMTPFPKIAYNVVYSVQNYYNSIVWNTSSLYHNNNENRYNSEQKQ